MNVYKEDNTMTNTSSQATTTSSTTTSFRSPLMRRDHNVILNPSLDDNRKDIDANLSQNDRSNKKKSNVGKFIQEQRQKLKNQCGDDDDDNGEEEYQVNDKKVHAQPKKEDIHECEDEKEMALPQDSIVETIATGENKAFFVHVDEDDQSDAEQQTSLPILDLGNFQESVWLDFGSEKYNVVGKARSRSFVLRASSTNKEDYHTLEVEKVPSKKGFTMTRCNNSDADIGNQASKSLTGPFYIKKGDEETLTLTWTPTIPGGVRETIYLKMQRGRIRIIAKGAAKAVPIKKNVMGSSDRLRTLSEFMGRIKRNTPSPREFKPVQATSRRARKNDGPLQPWMTYDDSFADKQCEAYTTWLNFVLKPTEHYSKLSSEDGSIDPPTLKSLLIERRRFRASQQALSFYNGPEMQSIRTVLVQEILSNRLSMRSDHDVLANVNLKSQMISLIMSYSVPWLKLILETMFGESITLDELTEHRSKDAKIRKSLGIASPKSKKVSVDYNSNQPNK